MARKYRDIVIIPDDSEKHLRYIVKIGKEPIEQTFASLEQAKSAALAAIKPVTAAEVKV